MADSANTSVCARRSALAFAGCSALLIAIVAWRAPVIRNVRTLPQAERGHDWIGAETDARPACRTIEAV